MLASQPYGCDYPGMRIRAPLIALLLLVIVPLGHSQQQPLLVLQHWWVKTAPTPAVGYFDCMTVQTDGALRFEHAVTPSMEPVSYKIYQRQLSDDEMKQLRSVLDDPALEAVITPHVGSDKFTASGYDIDLLSARIRRDNQIQSLTFDSTAKHTAMLQGGVKLPSVYANPAMKPLLHWYEDITKSKGKPDKSASPTCHAYLN